METSREDQDPIKRDEFADIEDPEVKRHAVNINFTAAVNQEAMEREIAILEEMEKLQKEPNPDNARLDALMAEYRAVVDTSRKSEESLFEQTEGLIRSKKGKVNHEKE